MTAMPATGAVLIPIGPGPREVERTADLLDALWSHEPTITEVVLVDDAPGLPARIRNLLAAVGPPAGCRVTVVPNPRNGRGSGLWGGLCVGVLAGLRFIQSDTDAAFAVKLDTDALVIGPFASAIRKEFAEHPDVAVVGSYDRRCDGTPRDFAPSAPTTRELTRLVRVKMRPPSRGRYVQQTLWGDGARVRRRIQAAVAQGLSFGEHCQGGAYAVSRRLLERMREARCFDEWPGWLHTAAGEDAMMAVYARALGMSLRGMVDDGQPFAVFHQGLAGTCAWLAESGYALIHSVKNDARATEAEIRAFFRARRGRAS
jgi:hypothetical protein